MKTSNARSRAYKIFSIIVLVILAILFLFPLYWIITGAFKPAQDIYSQKPVWWPTEWVTNNFQSLFAKRTAPLFSLFGVDGPVAPAAFRWLLNTVFMAVMAMLLTCVTAAMAGYALAKKRFVGRAIVFSLIVCAMALPKQVILIPLLKEMSALKLYDSLWAVIFPTVGWPFGVFLMKQFSESIPGEILEATRIDGASEAKTFITVVLPMVKPGIGALAIFTFINAWNDYFMQLVMLPSGNNYTLPLGIATLQGETSIDMGLLMAGAALASVPIIIVFLIFQKYFTQGITMGAVKGDGMIYAKNKDALDYRGIHPNLDLALEHIAEEYLASVGETRVELKGTDVYATRFTYETIPAEESFFEAHKKYLDIHIMTAGSERVEIAPPEKLTEFDHSDDFYAYRGEGDYKLVLSPGDFLVVFPGDAHRIKMQVDGPETVTKVVFKVRIH